MHRLSGRPLIVVRVASRCPRTGTALYSLTASTIRFIDLNSELQLLPLERVRVSLLNHCGRCQPSFRTLLKITLPEDLARGSLCQQREV